MPNTYFYSPHKPDQGKQQTGIVLGMSKHRSPSETPNPPLPRLNPGTISNGATRDIPPSGG